MLTPEHTQKLVNCAIPAELHSKLSMSSIGAETLVIEYLEPDGKKTLKHNGQPFVRERLGEAERDSLWVKLKRDNPNAKRPGKYRSSAGEGCRLYHSPLCVKQSDYQDRLDNINIDLRFTEGEFKTIAANIHDAKTITIGIGGVNSWRDRYDGQSKDEDSKPLVDFEDLKITGRRVRLCFDSDLHKPQVRAALRDLAHYFQGRGAIVIIEVLPSLPEQDSSGEWVRLGIDDLIHRCGAEAFQQIKKIAKPAFVLKKDEFEYKPEIEPTTSHRRNVYLKALIGNEWKANQEQSNSWWQWTGTHWQLAHSSDALLRTIENVMEANNWEDREQRTVNSLLAAFRRSIGLELPRPVKGLVPCLNGCLRLSDGSLVSHHPNHGNTFCLAFDFNPLASHNPITGVLSKMVTPVELVIFQAALQSIVTGKHRKAFIEITGPGNSGKSVFGRLATAIAGASNTVAVDLEKIEDKRNRFETIKLRGSRLAVFNECDKYSGPLNVLKSMTGADKITAELKKSTAQVDFYFDGVALLIGNSPVRPSDATGAVINRRRSIVVPQVIGTADERELLEPDGGGWRGEFAAHLSGLLNWALAISEADAKQALGKDSNDLGRIERDRDTLLDTDNLARWAEDYLIYDPEHPYSQVGNPKKTYLNLGTSRDQWKNLLLPHYEERVEFSVGLVKFKNKLVDLLRDTFELPLPKGSTRHGEYRNRTVGSVIPNVRLRGDGDEGMAGIITQASLWKFNSSRNGQPVSTQQTGDGQNPVSEQCDGCDDLKQITPNKKHNTPFNPLWRGSEKNAQTHFSSNCKGSAHHAPVTADFTHHAAIVTPSQAPTEPLMNHQVATVRDWVSAASDALSDAGLPVDADSAYDLLKAWTSAPNISRPEVAVAISKVPITDGQESFDI